MPNLISGRVLTTPLDRLSPTRYQFLDLSNAQPALGASPSTSTGFTLITTTTGTSYVSSLGNLDFNFGTITPNISSLNTITLSVSSSGTIVLQGGSTVVTGNMTFTNTASTITLGGRSSERIPNYYKVSYAR